MSISIILIYLIVAIVAGIVAGLFGGGIGLILIPAMVWMLNLQHFPQDLIMHTAIGTSVTAIIFIGAFSSYSHHKRNAVYWQYLKKMSVMMMGGIVIGAIVANAIANSVLIFIFSIITILSALYVLMGQDNAKNVVNASPLFIHCGAILIGFFGSIIGVNAFSVPFFQKIGMDIRIAIGTSAVIGTLLAFGIAIMYFITGMQNHTESFPQYCTGYIYWMACIPLAIGGSLFSPIGTKMAHALPRKPLKIAYAIFLGVIAIKMIMTAFAFA